MSSLVSFVTEPFRKRDLPDVYEFLRGEGYRRAYTTYGDSKGYVTFAGVILDASEPVALEFVASIVGAIADILFDDADFVVVALTESGVAQRFTAKNERAKSAAFRRAFEAKTREEAAFRRAFEAKTREEAVMRMRADRDAAQAEGMVTPGLDRFLDQ
jgi:hypothetical protein